MPQDMCHTSQTRNQFYPKRIPLIVVAGMRTRTGISVTVRLVTLRMRVAMPVVAEIRLNPQKCAI